MSLRRIVIALLVAFAAFAIAYGAASVVVWNKLTDVPTDCRQKWGANSPESFAVPTSYVLDTQPWAMPAPEEVILPSRDSAITIAAWWLPAVEPDAPAVLVVHGFGACRRDHAVLLPAGMLHRNGFSVLLIDLRDHGDSTIEDGRFAGGTDEYRDVLGAWDWMQTEKGIRAERIGLLGISLGAATVLLATGQEPRVAAVWEDSSYADLDSAIQAELAREGYPGFLSAGGVLAARLISGDDLVSYSPLDAVKLLQGRPLFITHGTSDTRLSVSYAHTLETAVRADGGDVETWIVPGAEHAEAMLTQTAEYERRLVDFMRRTLPSAP
jgi:hypothetical protein